MKKSGPLGTVHAILFLRYPGRKEMLGIKKVFLSSVFLCLYIATTSGATAAPITFNLEYSGVSFGNTATATGTITFEDALLPNPGSILQVIPSPLVLDISLTVSGSSAGNGTFVLADFAEVAWDTSGGILDYTRELIGQSTLDAPWGTVRDGSAGDFNLLKNNPLAPSGTWYFELTVGGSGEQILLTSMSAVPIPAAAWLFGSGLIGLAGIARRKKAY